MKKLTKILSYLFLVLLGSWSTAFGATVILTNSSDTLTTLRTNVNTSLTNLNAGLATTSQPSSSNILTSNGTNGVYGTATSTLSATGLLSLSNSPSIIGVSGAVLSLPLAKGNFIVGNDAGTAQATSSIFISSTGNVGIGTTSPGTLLSLGNTGANTINISATATSTFGSGLNVLTGCFAVNGVCVGGSGTVTLSGVVTGTGATSITTAFGSQTAGVLGNAATGNTGVMATSTLYGDTATFGVLKVGIASTTPAFRFSVNTIGSDFYIDSAGKIVGTDTANAWYGRISPTHSFVLGTGTTTTFTASTTGSAYSPFLVMPFTGTLRQVRCALDASFLGVNVQVNGSNATPSYFVASTTIGVVGFTAGNTFSVGQKILVNFGTTTTSTATQANCTFDVTET